jgi:hypothetical protein
MNGYRDIVVSTMRATALLAAAALLILVALPLALEAQAAAH